MAIRKRSLEPDAPPLSPDVTCLLLGGYRCSPAEGSAEGFGGTLDLYIGGDVAIAAAWREHAAYLRQEAKRRGIEPDWGPRGDQFFAEARAVALDNGARIVCGHVWPRPEPWDPPLDADETA